MNPYTRVTLSLYVFIVTIMILFPPWSMQKDIHGDGKTEPVFVTEYRMIFSSSQGDLSPWEYDYGGEYSGRIDISLLLIQILTVSLLTFGFHEKWKTGEDGSPNERRNDEDQGRDAANRYHRSIEEGESS
jgi:hypothetical protein